MSSETKERQVGVRSSPESSDILNQVEEHGEVLTELLDQSKGPREATDAEKTCRWKEEMGELASRGEWEEVNQERIIRSGTRKIERDV